MSERDEVRSADLIVCFRRMKCDHPDTVLLFARDAESFVAFAEDAAAVVRSIQGGPLLAEVVYREAGYFSTARFARSALEGVLAAVVADGRRAAVLEQVKDRGESEGVERIVTDGFAEERDQLEGASS